MRFHVALLVNRRIPIGRPSTPVKFAWPRDPLLLNVDWCSANNAYYSSNGVYYWFGRKTPETSIDAGQRTAPRPLRNYHRIPTLPVRGPLFIVSCHALVMLFVMRQVLMNGIEAAISFIHSTLSGYCRSQLSSQFSWRFYKYWFDNYVYVSLRRVRLCRSQSSLCAFRQPRKRNN